MDNNKKKKDEAQNFNCWINVPKRDILCYEYAKNKEEHFLLPTEAVAEDGIPAGELKKYQWNESKIYPGVKWEYWIYIPHQYKGQEVNLIIFLDGNMYLKEAKVPIVLDHLIHKGEIPVMIALFINPGDKGPGLPYYGGTDNRSIEYDSIDNRYASILADELIPEVKKEYNISSNPDKCGISGFSSSGNAAFAVAWHRPDLFSKVISHVGSFTNIRGGHNFPSMIRQNEKKPLRVYLQTGEHDLNTYFGDWLIANQDMASALNYKDYDYKLVIGPGGHSLRYGASTLPDCLRWIWR